MDLLELINQKAFLGQEYLTWLWYLSERDEPARLPDGRAVRVVLGDRLTLGPAPGAEGARVAVRGQETSLAEARQALKRGKLVESLRLGLELDGEEYWLTLNAAELGISSLKTPAVAQPAEGAGSPEAGREGLVLERVALIEEALAAVEGLFAAYLARRLDEAEGAELHRALVEWAAA
jgi:recombination associated protein RdgC